MDNLNTNPKEESGERNPIKSKEDWFFERIRIKGLKRSWKVWKEGKQQFGFRNDDEAEMKELSMNEEWAGKRKKPQQRRKNKIE